MDRTEAPPGASAAVRADEDDGLVVDFARIPRFVLLAGVSGNAIAVYAALALHADREDEKIIDGAWLGHAWPRRHTLAQHLAPTPRSRPCPDCGETHGSTDTVDDALRELRDAGLVEWREKRRQGGTRRGSRMSNEYRIRVVPLPTHRTRPAPKAAPAPDASPAETPWPTCVDEPSKSATKRASKYARKRQHDQSPSGDQTISSSGSSSSLAASSSRERTREAEPAPQVETTTRRDEKLEELEERLAAIDAATRARGRDPLSSRQRRRVLAEYAEHPAAVLLAIADALEEGRECPAAYLWSWVERPRPEPSEASRFAIAAGTAEPVGIDSTAVVAARRIIDIAEHGVLDEAALAAVLDEHHPDLADAASTWSATLRDLAAPTDARGDYRQKYRRERVVADVLAYIAGLGDRPAFLDAMPT